MPEITLTDRATAARICLQRPDEGYTCGERRAVLKVILEHAPAISNIQLACLLGVSEGQIRLDRKAIGAPRPPRHFDPEKGKQKRRKDRYTNPLLRALGRLA